MNNFKYESGEDPNNKCINIPRYRAGGRVSPDGKRYPRRDVKMNETEYVPVRSIISKSYNNSIVTPDCIGDQYKDMTEGAAIGTSFGTSLTENITQSALGLKHGGHERVLAEEGYLKAPKACKASEEGNFIILNCDSGGKLKYPRPENFIISTQEGGFKAGDIIGTAYNTTSPINKLNCLLSLMHAVGNRAKKYYEKDNVIESECYAYEDGIINYEEDPKSHTMIVCVGSTRYSYNPSCMYYYPSGTKIKKFQRICSGVADMPRVISRMGNDINGIYTIFRDQFYTLSDPGFRNRGYLEPDAMQEELVEMIFISLLKVDYDYNQDKIDSISYLGTNSGIMNSKSFYTMLSYGYSSNVISKAIKGETEFRDDIITSTVLGLLVNNKLDN